VTHRYTVLQGAEKTWSILSRWTLKCVMFVQKYKDKQFIVETFWRKVFVTCLLVQESRSVTKNCHFVNTLPAVGQNISVSIVTCYRLVGPEIKSRWGLDFLQLRRPALRPTQSPVEWVPCLFPRQRHGIDHPLPSNAGVKERVELCLYCPSESSWSVLGCILPYLYIAQLAQYCILSVLML
jgi:hypothetical protein